MNSEPIKIRRYVLMYAGYYLLCAACLAVVLVITNVQLSYSLELSMVLAASMGLATRFVKENSRVPSLQEKRKLGLACMLASAVLSVLLTTVSVLFFSESGQAGENLAALLDLPAFVWLLVLAFSMGLNYLILNLSLGWFARKTEASWKAKGRLG
jgi:hypothetical protein